MSSRRSLVFAALGTLMLPGLAMAADITTPGGGNRGYVVDANSNVVRSGQGACVRSGEWSPALAASAAACRLCTPDLCPVQAAALPPPRLVQAPPQPAAAEPAMPLPSREPQRISMAADTLFDFDKAELKPEGRALLDALASEIATMNYESIAITGHADRIGDAEYNRQLSERRAGAVREYLLSKNATAEGSVSGYTGGDMAVDPNKITARGVGEEQPVTRADECTGNSATKSLIQCLAPDRRVEIEVTGTE